MRSTLVVMPTGTGKTIVLASAIKEGNWPGRILVIQHRQELAYQNAEKIETVTSYRCSTEMGQHMATSDTKVVVASVQSLNAKYRGDWRMKRFDPHEFSLIVTDEAHHSTAKSYRRVYEWFGKNPNICHLGVTATPDRTDEEALGQIFDSVAYEYSILDAIDDGWLVPIKQQFIKVEGMDLSSLRSRAGDLEQERLAKIMETEEMLHRVAHPTLELAGDRPTLVFTCSVQQAHDLADIFHRHRDGCARAVDGTTPDDKRRGDIRAFKEGKFQFFVNCGIFLEGFDAPQVACVSMARPTKSRALYAQVIGRGTRPLPGVVDGPPDPASRRQAIADSAKQDVLVLDFVGQSGRHKLVSTADILSGYESDEVVDWAIKEAQEKGEPVNMRELFDEGEAEIAKTMAQKLAVTGRAIFKSIPVGDEPFVVLGINKHREPAWHKGRRPTKKQLAALQKFGIDEKQVERQSFVTASQLLDRLINRSKEKLCTYKQSRILKRSGYGDRDFTMAEASKVIDALAKNKWQHVPLERILG